MTEKVDNNVQVSVPTISNIPKPPPFLQTFSTLQNADLGIPGDIQLDADGQLLKKYLIYGGFSKPIIDIYDDWLDRILPEQIRLTSLPLPSSHLLVFRLHYELPRQTPMECREANITYSIDLSVTIEEVDKTGKVLRNIGQDPNGVRRYSIGSIPLMLGSKYSHVFNKTPHELEILREDPSDPFGYFVIKGIERVLLLQENLRTNRIFVFPGQVNAKSANKGYMTARMTCNTLKQQGLVLLTEGENREINLTLQFMGTESKKVAETRETRSEENEAKEQKSEEVEVKRPSKKPNSIGVFQAFRILAAKIDTKDNNTNSETKLSTFKNLMAAVVKFTLPQWQREVTSALTRSFDKLYMVADDYYDLARKKGLISEGRQLTDEMRQKLFDDFNKDLFPHVETTELRQKFNLLAIMSCKLIEVMIGKRTEADNRDSWSNKRLQSAGNLLPKEFGRFWNRLLKQVLGEMEKSTLSSENIARILSEQAGKHVTLALESSFTGQWGAIGGRGGKLKEGSTVTDVLNANNIVSLYAHIRRINTPTDRSTKQSGPRSVQTSQYGFVCPVETPENENCLHEDEEVLMADGSYKKMKDLKNGDIITTIDPVTFEVSTTGIHNHFLINSDKYGKKVYELTTINGLKIVATEDHPFLTPDGWVLLKDLDVETDKVAVYTDSSCAFIQITNVKDHPACTVGDFTTDSDTHTFVTRNGYITHNCGLVKNLAITCTLSIDTDDKIVAEMMRPYLSAEPTLDKRTIVILNGKPMGWAVGTVLRDYLRQQRRQKIGVPWHTCVALDKYATLHVYTDGARPIRPLLIVNDHNELIIDKKNLWQAPWEDIVAQGAAEFVDAFEAEYIYIAPMVQSIKFAHQQITKAKENLIRAQADLDRFQKEDPDVFLTMGEIREIEEYIRNQDSKENKRALVATEPEKKPEKTDEEDLFDADGELRITAETKNYLVRRVQKNEEILANMSKKPPYTHCELDPTSLFSVASSLTPFSDHNQAPRNTFNAKMTQQAVSVPRGYQYRDETMKVLTYPQRAMFETQTAGTIGMERFPTGQPVPVVIATWGGFNQEDSIVFNKTAIDNGLFAMYKFKSYEDTEAQAVNNNNVYIEEKIQRPEPRPNDPPSIYRFLDERGLAKEGSSLKAGDCVIGKVQKVTIVNKETNVATIRIRNISKYIGFGEEGVVDRVLIVNSKSQKIIKVRTRQFRQPVIGDKFAHRSAQKGTIGMILPDVDMPEIGFGARATKPALIINPASIPSRMTMGMILEIFGSTLGSLQGERYNASAFRPVDIDEWIAQMRQYGFQPMGNHKLRDPYTGEMTDAMVFSGIAQYMQLRHHVKDKYQARATGPVNPTTRQPVHGRGVKGGGGGLRLGRWNVTHSCHMVLLVF